MTRYEQETIINFNDEEKTASVYTCNKSLRNRLAAFAADRPDECVFKMDDGYAVWYTVPKKWVRIKPPRTVSDAQREHMRNINFTRKTNTQYVE